MDLCASHKSTDVCSPGNDDLLFPKSVSTRSAFRRLSRLRIPKTDSTVRTDRIYKSSSVLEPPARTRARHSSQKVGQHAERIHGWKLGALAATFAAMLMLALWLTAFPSLPPKLPALVGATLSFALAFCTSLSPFTAPIVTDFEITPIVSACRNQLPFSSAAQARTCTSKIAAATIHHDTIDCMLAQDAPWSFANCERRSEQTAFREPEQAAFRELEQTASLKGLLNPLKVRGRADREVGEPPSAAATNR